MKKYLNRATKTNLQKSEGIYLSKGLFADKELVMHIDMSPAKLPDLVINNPGIAVDLLVCMTNTAQITKYYDVLSTMKLSTALLEVFNGLSHHVEFPKEFIQFFLRNCMHQCSCSTENKVNKNRMVRLVNVFLWNIMKSKVINFEDIVVDVKQFCIEHNGIKECQDMLKYVISETAQKNL